MERLSSLRGVAEILIFLSTATLFYRREVLYLFKPFEIGILCAVLCALAYALNEKRNIVREIPNVSLWLTLFALMLFFSAIGTVNGYLIYGIAEPLKTAGGFFYLGINMAAFLLVLQYGRARRFRYALRLSFISSLAFAPFVFMPGRAEQLGFITEEIHFWGLHKSPTTFAFLASIACIVLAGEYFGASRKIPKAFYAAGIVLMFSLSLWTGSRAALLALTLAFMWTVLHNQLLLVTRTSLVLTALIAIAVSFSILPHRVQIMALDRIYPHISGNLPDPDRFDTTSLTSAFGSMTELRPSLPYQSRQSLWPQSIALFARNPIGLGVEYFRSAQAIRQDGHATHSHNTLLQIGLTGGIGLLITCVFFLRALFIQLARSAKDAEWLTLTGMLAACFAFLMIGEFFYIAPWVWIIAALASVKADDTATVPPK